MAAAADAPNYEAQYQEVKDTLLAAKSTWTALECQFLSEDSLRRYLIACAGDVQLASQTILDTLTWRAEKKADFCTIQDHKVHFDMKKIYANGKCKSGYPLIYMRPALDPNFDLEGKVPFFIWNFEYCLRNTTDKISWIVDCSGFPYHYLYQGHIGMAAEVAGMLANNYPERLGTIYIVNAPWIFSSFWAICSTWLKPVTKDKVMFVTEFPQMLDSIETHVLEKDFGGSNEFVFDPEVEFAKHAEEEKDWLQENQRLAGITVESPKWPLDL